MPLSESAPRLLVLDDDDVMRGLLEAVLCAEWTTTLAAQGTEAVQLLRTEAPFAAVLSDVRMPGLEGIDLAEALRAAAPPGTPLIGMSGSQPTLEVSGAFDAFLLKPFSLQLLRDAFVAAKQRKTAAPETARGAEEARANAETPPLDERIFGSLLAMLPADQLLQLFAMALTDIGKRHARMEQAMLAGDLAQVGSEAHAVKGSCGMIGALELRELAAAIERDTTSVAWALAEIPAACQRLQRMLDGKLHSL